jgi:hypothetical protein
MDFDDEAPDSASEFNEMMTTLTDSCEQMGLYAISGMIQSSASEEQVAAGTSPRELMEEGEEFYIRATFRIGDLAWSDRILRPEQFAQDQEFEKIAPTEEEVMLERIRSEGASLLNLDDEEEED